MKINQIKQEIEAKTAEVRTFTDAKDLEGAKKAMEELRTLKETLKLEEELEVEEKRELENQKLEERSEVKTMTKGLEMRAIVKQLLGQELTKEERAVIVSSKVGTVIPAEFLNTLEEYRKGFAPLKDICHVIPVTSSKGSMPCVDLTQNDLADLVEGADIVEGDLVTTDIQYQVAPVGLLNKLSWESVDDGVVDLEGLTARNFAEISVIKENAKILATVTAGAVATTSTATDLQTVLEAEMASALPSVQAGLVTLVNTPAYVALKNKKDADGKSLDLITVIGGQEYFNNKPIYRFDDVFVAVADRAKKVAFVLNAKEAIKYFDRNQVTIDKAEKFENGAKMVRILERFQVKAGNVRSAKKVVLA